MNAWTKPQVLRTLEMLPLTQENTTDRASVKRDPSTTCQCSQTLWNHISSWKQYHSKCYGTQVSFLKQLSSQLQRKMASQGEVAVKTPSRQRQAHFLHGKNIRVVGSRCAGAGNWLARWRVVGDKVRRCLTWGDTMCLNGSEQRAGTGWDPGSDKQSQSSGCHRRGKLGDRRFQRARA